MSSLDRRSFLKTTAAGLAAIPAAGGAVLRPRRDAFYSLARSIVGQQVSVASAEAVWQRLMAHVGEVRPESVAAADAGATA